MNSLVSLTACEDYDDSRLKASLVELLKPLGGIAGFVRPGMNVLLKPNLLMAKPAESCVITHPALIRAVAELVLSAGGVPAVGDGPALVGAKTVCRTLGLSGDLRRRGVKVVNFQKTRLYAAPQGSRWQEHRLCTAFEEFDLVINLPKFKTHSMMLLSLAVKNIFGFAPQAERISWHCRAGVQRDMFAEMLVDDYLIVRPALSICDGVWGMEGEGPGSGDPVKLGFLAASKDAFALDDVLARLVGLSTPLHTTQAAERRAVYKAGRYRLVGAGFERFKPASFAWPRSLDAGDLGVSVPGPLRGFVKRYLTDSPRVTAELCDGCGRCRQICSVKVITIRDKGGPARIDLGPCLRCFCCHEVCPRGAIKVKRSRVLRLLNWLF